jgi:hypothetical protein
MNSAYIPVILFIFGVIINGIGFAIMVAYRSGQEQKRVERIEVLERDLGNTKASLTILQADIANVRGYLRGSHDFPPNGGS